MSENCPNCGSDLAVPKSTAWDALTRVPPKIELELIQLRELRNLASRLVARAPDAQTTVVTVPSEVYEAIRAALPKDAS